MIYIGDIHGDIELYHRFLNLFGDEPSIQVGDFGFGFCRPKDQYPPQHRFIRGNHDNPDEIIHHPNYIKDFTIEGTTLYIGGADSIDKKFRTPGVSWWPNEECSLEQFIEFIKYDGVIETVITHDCPHCIKERIHSHHRAFPSTVTNNCLQWILEKYKPKLWVFGHHHLHWDYNYNGTLFICVKDGEYIDV